MATICRMESKVIAAGRKPVDLERVEPAPVPDYTDQAVPDEFSGAFAAFMADRMRHFCGRRFVFAALDAFLEEAPAGSGYFLITGDPGIGKSALMAKLIHDRKYLHHFNIGPQSINQPHHFLTNICSQLIHRYDLSCKELSPDATRDGVLLNRLMVEAAGKLGKGEKIVIAVDALDDIDRASLVSGHYLNQHPGISTSDLTTALVRPAILAWLSGNLGLLANRASITALEALALSGEFSEALDRARRYPDFIHRTRVQFLILHARRKCQFLSMFHQKKRSRS